jgi:hypothetical protein
VVEISINSIFIFFPSLFSILLSNFLSYFSTSFFLDGNTLHSLCSIKHPIVKAPSLCCPTRDGQFKTISRTTSIHVVHTRSGFKTLLILSLTLSLLLFFYSGSLILLCMSGFEQHVFYTHLEGGGPYKRTWRLCKPIRRQETGWTTGQEGRFEKLAHSNNHQVYIVVGVYCRLVVGRRSLSSAPITHSAGSPRRIELILSSPVPPPP